MTSQSQHDELYHEPNEIQSQFLHLLAMSAFPVANSASRNQMAGSHLCQTLTVAGSANPATGRLVQTGIEREFGKYTFSIQMPANGRVLHIFPVYPPTLGKDGIKENTYTLVIYEDTDTGEIGCIELQGYHSAHQYFGFIYKKSKTLHELRVGAYIEKGARFMISPDVDDHGNYNPGVSLNVALITDPATSEDGIMISRAALEKLRFTKIITREVEWGSDSFPLNIYGDETTFKAFPDIGEWVAPNEVLMALRKIDPLDNTVAGKSQSQVRKIDYTFDETTYVAAGPAKILDIRVYKDQRKSPQVSGTDGQCDKYVLARYAFAQKLINAYHGWKKIKKGEVKLSARLHALLIDAQADLTDLDPKQPKITRQFKCEPLDICRVEFVLQQDVIPNIGNKATDTYGGR